MGLPIFRADGPLIPLSYNPPTYRNGRIQPKTAHGPFNIRIPLGFAAQIHTFRPNMTRGLTWCDESQVPRLARRVVDSAAIGPQQCEVVRMGHWKRHCNTLSPRLREDLGRKSDRLRVRCDLPGSCLSRDHDGLDSQSRCERKSDGLGLAIDPQFDA